jgi:hypothetical protein
MHLVFILCTEIFCFWRLELHPNKGSPITLLFCPTVFLPDLINFQKAAGLFVHVLSKLFRDTNLDFFFLPPLW